MYSYQVKYIEQVKQFDLKNKKILEIGCSNGILVSELQKEDPEKVIGIDINIKNLILSKNTILIKMDASNLQFPDNYFDYVFSLATFEHIMNPKVVLDEAWRVLKPNGIFFCRFAPIWTAINGHHYKIWDYDNEILLPPWGHLFLNYNDMYNYLKKIYKEEDTLLACEYIYKSNEINRIEYKEYIKMFSKVKFREFKYERIIKKDSENYLNKQIQKLLKNYTKEELITSGFILYGRK